AAARGQMGTALTAYREALAALDKASDPNLFAKARLLQNQGELLARRDDPNSAARYFERALELMTRLQGSEHPDLVRPLTGLGTVAQGRGQHDEAYRRFERALDLVDQRTSSDPLVVGSIELSMAD